MLRCRCRRLSCLHPVVHSPVQKAHIAVAEVFHDPIDIGGCRWPSAAWLALPVDEHRIVLADACLSQDLCHLQSSLESAVPEKVGVGNAYGSRYVLGGLRAYI